MSSHINNYQYEIKRNWLNAAIKGERDIKSLTKMLIVVCAVFVIISVPTCIYLIESPYVFTRTSPHHIVLLHSCTVITPLSSSFTVLAVVYSDKSCAAWLFR